MDNIPISRRGGSRTAFKDIRASLLAEVARDGFAWRFSNRLYGNFLRFRRGGPKCPPLFQEHIKHEEQWLIC